MLLFNVIRKKMNINTNQKTEQLRGVIGKYTGSLEEFIITKKGIIYLKTDKQLKKQKKQKT